MVVPLTDYLVTQDNRHLLENRFEIRSLLKYISEAHILTGVDYFVTDQNGSLKKRSNHLNQTRSLALWLDYENNYQTPKAFEKNFISPVSLEDILILQGLSDTIAPDSIRIFTKNKFDLFNDVCDWLNKIVQIPASSSMEFEKKNGVHGSLLRTP